jgi:hypothetical protein
LSTLKQDRRPTEESGAGDYRIHQIDSSIPVEGVSLAGFRIDGDNQQPLFGPRLDWKLCCYDLPPVCTIRASRRKCQRSDSPQNFSWVAASLFRVS